MKSNTVGDSRNFRPEEEFDVEQELEAMMKAEASKRRRSREQSLKDLKEELELLKHKAEVDKLKEEDIERQLRMSSKKI